MALKQTATRSMRAALRNRTGINAQARAFTTTVVRSKELASDVSDLPNMRVRAKRILNQSYKHRLLTLSLACTKE